MQPPLPIWSGARLQQSTVRPDDHRAGQCPSRKGLFVTRHSDSPSARSVTSLCIPSLVYISGALLGRKRIAAT